MHSTFFAMKRGYYSGLRVARELLDGKGLTPARFDLLYLVRGGPGEFLLQSDVRRALGVAGPTVSRMIRSLMELGFLVKLRAPHDRRERIVQLTEKGRRVLAKAIRATMGPRKVERLVAGALAGARRRATCGRVAAVGLEEVLLRVRTAFGDRARLLYVFNPYEWGWRPPRSAPLYDEMLTAP